MTSRVARIAALSVLLLPAIGLADMFKPSKQQQLQLGRQGAAEVRKKEKILPSSDRRVVELRHIAAKLLAALPKDKNAPWEYSFDIIESKEINAFSLPGGPVFFCSALVDKFETEDQFAAVLAHEMTHVRKEHWAYSYADNVKRKLGLTVLLTVLNANDTMFNMADVSDDLLFTLPYSRKHESEADALGCDNMVEAGFNPQGMVDVFGVLRKYAGTSSRMEFLSDHPGENERIKRIKERIEKMHRTFPGQTPVPY